MVSNSVDHILFYRKSIQDSIDKAVIQTYAFQFLDNVKKYNCSFVAFFLSLITFICKVLCIFFHVKLSIASHLVKTS